MIIGHHVGRSAGSYDRGRQLKHMLLALAVMFVYYLVNGRDAMLVFFLVFMAFYLVSLIHHSVFFARVSNRS